MFVQLPLTSKFMSNELDTSAIKKLCDKLLYQIDKNTFITVFGPAITHSHQQVYFAMHCLQDTQPLQPMLQIGECLFVGNNEKKKYLCDSNNEKQESYDKNNHIEFEMRNPFVHNNETTFTHIRLSLPPTKSPKVRPINPKIKSYKKI